MSALASYDLGRRSSETELMDTEPVDIDEYRRCLQDLANVNTVTLVGQLTADPELRQLPDGRSVCALRLAVSGSVCSLC